VAFWLGNKHFQAIISLDCVSPGRMQRGRVVVVVVVVVAARPGQARAATMGFPSLHILSRNTGNAAYNNVQ
jgi:hypothetical protein